MSYSEAVVTGFIFASCTAVMNYVVNRLVVRPLDRKLTEFEKWAKEKLPNILSDRKKEDEQEKGGVSHG
jgi:hypothetical protein